MRKTQRIIAKSMLLPALALAVTSCSDDLTAPATGDGHGLISLSVPAGGFATERCKVVTITPEAQKPGAYSWAWTSGDSLLSNAQSLDFISVEEGNYPVRLVCRDTVTTEADTLNFSINVSREAKAYSPYVAKVTDYRPAPGQFVNQMPLYEEGDTHADMCQKALAAIGSNARGIVTLGSFGGYIVCQFDHTIANLPGKTDFKVLGNTFAASGTQGGSSEPGIVMVAYDRNNNGLPDDDEWFELAGSEYNNPSTHKNYEITYNRPSEGHTPIAPPAEEASWNSDAEYIAWSDNLGNGGFMPKNKFHQQDYFPRWIDEGQMTFNGTLLPQNGIDQSGNGTYWVLKAFPWGYADNRDNESEMSNFDIDWAVDNHGNRVKLPGIDFVKIYTGIRQQCGWLGETSTEVSGITDLNISNNK